MSRNFLFIASFALLVGCNKAPGKGGTSSISGKVYRIETNVLGDILDEYYIADKDVYIIYGDEDLTYDDKFSTSLDGSFKFTHLLPGTYTIFTYSRCDTCAGGDQAIMQTVEITEKKKDYLLEDIITYK